MGPCAGGAVYSPAITDFVFMVEGTSYMFVTGPEVIKTVTHEEVTKEELGGAATHAAKSGVCHFTVANDAACLAAIRELLSYLPSNNLDEPPPATSDDDPDREDEALDALVPEDPNKPYDIKQLIHAVVDDGKFLEVHAEYAKNIVVGFARFANRAVGIVANQPAYLAGVLDIDASLKGARFVRFCDAFNIPLVTFEDVPGFLPGTQQEFGGIIKHGAKLLYAFAEATVPKITVITRKAYGGAYCVMASQAPAHRRQPRLPDGRDRGDGAGGRGQHPLPARARRRRGERAAEVRAEKVAEYREKFSNPYIAAERGFVDAVIEPRATRPRDRPRPAPARRQAQRPAAQEARQHPALRSNGRGHGVHHRSRRHRDGLQLGLAGDEGRQGGARRLRGRGRGARAVGAPDARTLPPPTRARRRRAASGADRRRRRRRAPARRARRAHHAAGDRRAGRERPLAGGRRAARDRADAARAFRWRPSASAAPTTRGCSRSP